MKRGDQKWIKAIPKSSAHGSGDLQKRLWRLTSDFVRIRDWYKYGRCVATGKPINHWTEGQAGHFKAWSKCNGIFKFDPRNIHLQSAASNSWGDFDDWKIYEAELQWRGYDLDELHRDNLKLQASQLTDTMVLGLIEDVLEKMAELPEQPEYYERVIKLKSQST